AAGMTAPLSGLAATWDHLHVSHRSGPTSPIGAQLRLNGPTRSFLWRREPGAVRLPWPAAGQLHLQREAQEGADQDDAGADRHAGESGLAGDSADDIPGDQQLQAKQDGLAELLAEAPVGAGLVVGEADGGGTSVEHRTDDDDGDPGAVDDLSDPCDDVGVVHL